MVGLQLPKVGRRPCCRTREGTGCGGDGRDAFRLLLQGVRLASTSLARRLPACFVCLAEATESPSPIICGVPFPTFLPLCPDHCRYFDLAVRIALLHRYGGVLMSWESELVATLPDAYMADVPWCQPLGADSTAPSSSAMYAPSNSRDLAAEMAR